TAYDGREGMLVIPSSSDRNTLACAIKIWYESRENFADTVRMNFYYPDRIERYWTGEDGKFTRYTADGLPPVLDWTHPDGKPIGVPVVHFANQRRGKSGFGVSELANVITLQDGHNRALHSMLMTTELSGFPVKYAIGFKPDAEVMPGMMIAVYPQDDKQNYRAPQDELEIAHLSSIRLGQLEAGDVASQLQVYEKLEDQIGATTSTPDIGSVSADASGEARKQAEVGLIGKIKRFQIKAGSAWTLAAWISQNVHNAFAAKPAPPTQRWRCQWQSPEVRNESQIIADAMALIPLIGKRAAIREVAKVKNWDETYIDQIMDELEGEQAALADSIMARLPAFNGQAAETGGSNG
nr:phage portal protein [Anaerolineae bacterium]